MNIREFATSESSFPAGVFPVSAAAESEASGAVVTVLIATVALSFKGIVAKLAYATGMGVDALMLVRFALAVPLLWLCARWLTKGAPMGLTRRQWMHAGVGGLAFFLAAYSDLTAVSLIDAGTSRLFLFTFPVFVILINAAQERRPPRARDMLTFAITYAGVALVALPKGLSALSPSQMLGMAWAVASAVTYAVYLTVSQGIMKEIGSARYTAASNTVTLAALAVSTGVSPTGHGALVLPDEGVFWGAVVAVGCTVIPFLLLFEGIRRCGAVRASLLTLSGPVVTAIGAWAILGETLSPVQIAGFAITLGSVATLSLPKDLLARLLPWRRKQTA